MKAEKIMVEKLIRSGKVKMLKKSWWGTGEVRNWLFTRVLESEFAYVYLLRSEDKQKHWEVVKRKVFTKYKNKKKGIVEIKFERYPSSRDFGVYGWCIGNYKDAEAKFKQLSIAGASQKKGGLLKPSLMSNASQSTM